MQINWRMLPKRYLLGVGLFLLPVLGLIIGAVHPYKHALGSQPVALPTVELLMTGTPIERVSILLGHSSTKITEKHYNPWNRARQEQAEADISRSWASDPLVILEMTKGTPEVHGKRVRAN